MPTDQADLKALQDQVNEIAALPAQADRVYQEIHTQLEAWYLEAQHDNDQSMMSQLHLMDVMAQVLAMYVPKQAIIVNSLLVGLHQMRDQRNTTLEKLEALQNGIDDIFTTEHPLLREVFRRVALATHESFWANFPYDFADKLGPEWQWWEADRLHTALTVPIEEVDDLGIEYGFTAAQLEAFRQGLKDLMHETLHEKEDIFAE